MESPEYLSATDSRDAVRRFEQICDRFEAAWKAGQRPRIEDYLPEVPDREQTALLCELILLEIDYRRLAGEHVHEEEILSRFPALGRDWLIAALNGTGPPGPPSAFTGQEPSPGLPETLPGSSSSSPPKMRLTPTGAGSELDIQTLLRKRLRFISVVILAVYAYSLGFGCWVISHDLALIAQSLIGLPPYVVTIGLTAVASTVLWSRCPVSLRQLRSIELLLFSLLTAAQAWEFSCDLFRNPQFGGSMEWAGTSEKNGPFLWFHAAYQSLTFFILIVSYATLIPSSWRRCICIVTAMAAVPLTISAVACVTTVVSPSTFFLFYMLPMSVYLSIAVAIAVYGTHRIELLRREAAEARKLGQYQLKELLGTGGMGEVYLAEHVLLKQPCAIKLIRSDRAGDPATLRRFEREVQATARLKHWNTVRIFDYGHAADGTFYYVMEYLPGLTLEHLVKQQGPLSPGRVVNILCQACLALREAHALGLVHRDIKPANIILCELGGTKDVVKLVDFGLVKAIDLSGHEETLTQEGTIAGTPAYMSPEQAAGHDHLDGRSDIYSLGAVAHFLLTGHPPFRCEKAIQYLVAHLHEAVQPMTDLRPEIPADLQIVVLRCLEKDPKRRFDDVKVLLDAFASCVCVKF